MFATCRGAGFGLASHDGSRQRTSLRSRHEGLLLDDYYGAKAMTLFRSLLADGAPTPAVFWSHRRLWRPLWPH